MASASRGSHRSARACMAPGTRGTPGGGWAAGMPVEPAAALRLPVHTLRGVGPAGAQSKCRGVFSSIFSPLV